MTQWERICLPMQKIWNPSLGQEDPLKEEMTTYSSTLAWKIPWTEEPGGLQSTGSQRVGHDWAHTQCIYANHNIWMGETKLMKMNLEKMLPNMRRNHVIFFCPHSLALLKTTSIWGECFRISQSKHHHFLYKSHFHFAFKHWDTLGGGELGEENERRGQRVGERPVGKVKGLRGGGGSMDFLQEKLAHHQRLTKEEYDFSVQKDLSEMNGNVVSNCCCCCSVPRSCPTICDPMDNSTPAPLSSTVSGTLLRFTFPELVMLE